MVCGGVHIIENIVGDSIGIYPNYNSECPQRYKIATIHALTHRTYKISSNWQLFHNHIHTLKQAFVNNSYPNHLFDTTLNRYLSKLNASPNANYAPPPTEPPQYQPPHHSFSPIAPSSLCIIIAPRPVQSPAIFSII